MKTVEHEGVEISKSVLLRMSHQQDIDIKIAMGIFTICAGIVLAVGLHVYDLLKRAEQRLISAKEKSSALQLKCSELEAQLERQQELCRKHSADLARSREELDGASSLASSSVARVRELKLKLKLVKQEKAGAEAEAEVKLKGVLAEKGRVEKELEAKSSEVRGQDENMTAYAEKLSQWELSQWETRE